MKTSTTTSPSSTTSTTTPDYQSNHHSPTLTDSPSNQSDSSLDQTTSNLENKIINQNFSTKQSTSSDSEDCENSYDTIQLIDLSDYTNQSISDSSNHPNLKSKQENQVKPNLDSEPQIRFHNSISRAPIRHHSEPVPTLSDYSLSGDETERPLDYNHDDIKISEMTTSEDDDHDLAEVEDDDDEEEEDEEEEEEEENCPTPVDNHESYSPSPSGSSLPLSNSANRALDQASTSYSPNSTPLKTPRSSLRNVLMSPDSDIIEDSMLYEEEFSSPTRPKSLQSRRPSEQLIADEDLHQELNPHSLQRAHTLSNLLSFSLWDHLKYEIDNADDEHVSESLKTTNLRSERVSNFLNVPIAIEKMILFGLVICLDAFLSVFTILPIRFFFSLCRLINNLFRRFTSIFISKSNRSKILRLNISNKIDLMQGILIILVCVVLHHITDASKMYHLVRGQETIKLYVIFNVLEIADRLCCSFGQDILDSLFSPSTLGRRTDGTQPRMKPMFLFILAFIFTVAHTLVLFYQLVSLNVAINSYDHSLITLLISNQFVEIKGSVFKKFEKENLFQMSCADIVERFQLALMLHVIAFRNLIELWDSASPTAHSTTPSHAYSLTYQYLPTSFNIFPSLSLLQTIFLPPVIVILSEVLVDWLKHAFITKFNHIRPNVYGRFIDLLCKDLVSNEDSPGSHPSTKGSRKIKPFVDRSPAVSRRLGFSVFPICCLTVRVIFQAWDMISESSNDESVSYIPTSTSISNPSITPFSTRGLQQQLMRISFLPTSLKLWLTPTHNPYEDSTNLIHDESNNNPNFSPFQINLLISLSILTGISVLLLLKLFIGIWLRIYSEERMKSISQREIEDIKNDRKRKPIGLSEGELIKEKEEKRLIELEEFDVPSHHSHRNPKVEPIQEEGEGISQEKEQGKGEGEGNELSNKNKRVQIPFEELGRFDMVRSRIW